jgi:hypothetical protein
MEGADMSADDQAVVPAVPAPAAGTAPSAGTAAADEGSGG